MDAKKVLKCVVLVVVLGNVVLMALVFLGSPSHKPTPMPNPNGYDDFVKAGGMLTKPKPYISDMDHDQLNAFVSTNEAALKLGRLGLSRECRIPDDYSAQYMNRYVHEPMAVKALAMAYCAQGKLAKMENRTNDAVEAYLACVELGEKSTRGGFMMAKLVGIACESLGRQGLQSFTGELPSNVSRAVLRKLESVDAEEEPFSEVWGHEKKFIRQSTTLGDKLRFWRAFLTIGESRNDVEAKSNANTEDRRKLMIAFAARAYELDKGKSPTTMADLVPNYLKAIPKDPVTGTNMVYSPR